MTRSCSSGAWTCSVRLRPLYCLPSIVAVGAGTVISPLRRGVSRYRNRWLKRFCWLTLPLTMNVDD